MMVWVGKNSSNFKLSDWDSCNELKACNVNVDARVCLESIVVSQPCVVVGFTSCLDLLDNCIYNDPNFLNIIPRVLIQSLLSVAYI